MADEQDLSKRIGLTRGKMALIGILSAALIGVLYIQYGRDGTEQPTAAVELVYTAAPPPQPPPSETSASSMASPTGAAPESTDQGSAPLADALDQSKWNSPDVTTIVGYDPFALPPGFPRPAQTAGDPQGLLGGDAQAADSKTRASQLADAVAQLNTELETLRQRGVRVIVKQRDEYVALIGDRTVRVGDEINGFTVTAIDPDGVRVERNVEQ